MTVSLYCMVCGLGILGRLWLIGSSSCGIHWTHWQQAAGLLCRSKMASFSILGSWWSGWEAGLPWGPLLSHTSSETLLGYLHYSRWTSYLMAQCPRDVPEPQEADAISFLSLFWETDIACPTIFFEAKQSSRPSGFNRKRERPTSWWVECQRTSGFL